MPSFGSPSEVAKGQVLYGKSDKALLKVGVLENDRASNVVYL